MAVGGELVVQRLAYAALDALRMAMPLDLCAYLHVVDAEGPQLYLRAPDLSSMTATQAFDVFTALRDAVDDSESSPGDRCAIGSFEAIAVRSRGARSKGVFVVGRRDGELTADERALVDTMCAAMGDACHSVEASDAPTTGTGSATLGGVSVRIDDGIAAADVTFTSAGGDVCRGSGSAPATTDAVALATLDALAPDRKLGDVAESLVGGERVIIAIVRDGDERVGLGVALVGSDPVRAAAEATASAATAPSR